MTTGPQGLVPNVIIQGVVLQPINQEVDPCPEIARHVEVPTSKAFGNKPPKEEPITAVVTLPPPNLAIVLTKTPRGITTTCTNPKPALSPTAHRTPLLSVK
jgi:hypothetical protein